MMRPEEVRTIWGDSKIEALTEYTVTDLDELFIILEEARENGYALAMKKMKMAFAALPPRSWITAASQNMLSVSPARPSA